MIINQFWFGDILPSFAIECMFRIKKFGYQPTLWVYEQRRPINIPKYVKVKDANELITFDWFKSRFLKSNLVKFTNGSKGNTNNKYFEGFAASVFSDIFRAKILHTLGGWWFDPDVLLISRLPNVKDVVSTLPRKLTSARARKHLHFPNLPMADVNSSVMRAPKGSAWAGEYLSMMMRVVEHLHRLKKYLPRNMSLLNLLPSILPRGVAVHPIFFNPIPYWTDKLGVVSWGYTIPTAEEIAKHSFTISLSGGPLKLKYVDILKQIEMHT